jgi:hypothetical protein
VVIINTCTLASIKAFNAEKELKERMRGRGKKTKEEGERKRT